MYIVKCLQTPVLYNQSEQGILPKTVFLFRFNLMMEKKRYRRVRLSTGKNLIVHLSFGDYFT